MRLLIAVLATLLASTVWAQDPPQVLQKRPGTPGVSWRSVDFIDLTNKPTTLDGYGITDAATPADRIQTGLDAAATAADRVQTGLDAAATAADRVQTGVDVVATGQDAAATAIDRATLAAVHVVNTLAFGADTTPVEPGTASTYWPSAGLIGGMVCHVTSAPYGGNITLDLQYGTPWTSAYPPGATPYIAEGETSTLTNFPDLLTDPPEIASLTPVRVVISGAPTETDLSGYVAEVADLTLYPPVGAKYGVWDDGHVWLRTQVWADQGLGWSAYVYDVPNLPTGIPNGTIYLVQTNTHRYSSNGDNTWTDLGLAYDGEVDTYTQLQALAPALNTVYRVNADSHRWLVVSAPWADQGLAKSPGSGLRCLTYLWPTPTPAVPLDPPAGPPEDIAPTPTTACTAGARAWDGVYLYTCVATDTWTRAPAVRTW